MEPALLQFTNDLYRELNDGKRVSGLFIDISKAFDTVSHVSLIRKLETAGVRGIIIEWFKSYLSERTQVVKVNNCTSTKRVV